MGRTYLQYLTLCVLEHAVNVPSCPKEGTYKCHLFVERKIITWEVNHIKLGSSKGDR